MAKRLLYCRNVPLKLSPHPAQFSRIELPQTSTSCYIKQNRDIASQRCLHRDISPAVLTSSSDLQSPLHATS